MVHRQGRCEDTPSRPNSTEETMSYKPKETISKEEALAKPSVSYWDVYNAIERASRAPRFTPDALIKEFGLFNPGYEKSWKKANDTLATFLYQLIDGKTNIDKSNIRNLLYWCQNNYYGKAHTFLLVGPKAVHEVLDRIRTVSYTHLTLPTMIRV